VTGQERLLFPGSREELVERALRFIAVQQIAKTKLTPDIQTGQQSVTVFFSLSMLRRHLEQLGHGFKLSEIKEALDILADTRIAVEEEILEAKTRRTRRTRDYDSILSHYTASTIEGDTSGDESYVAMTFHPAATAGVGKLKRPLARWLTTRMSHNYRQAHKPHFVNTGGEIVWKREGYHISLSTILAERGMIREARLRDNVATVRMALEEMKQAAFLAVDHPYDEKLSYTAGKGGKKITDAVWTLFPAVTFIEEIIQGNTEMAHNRAQRTADLWPRLPGFKGRASYPGEISAACSKSRPPLGEIGAAWP
jgi:hypothetical protein